MERHIGPPLKKPKLLVERTRHDWNSTHHHTVPVSSSQDSQIQNSNYFPGAFRSIDLAQPDRAFGFQPYHAPFSASPMPHTSLSAPLTSHSNQFPSSWTFLQEDAYNSFGQANHVSLTYPQTFISPPPTTELPFPTQATSLASLQPEANAMSAPQHPGDSVSTAIDLTGGPEQQPTSPHIADPSCNYQPLGQQGATQLMPEDLDFKMAFELQAQFVQASGLDSEEYLNALFLSENYEPGDVDHLDHVASGQEQFTHRFSTHVKAQNNAEPSPLTAHDINQFEDPFFCNEYHPPTLKTDLSAALNDLDLFNQRQAQLTCGSCASSLQRSHEASVKDLIRSWIDNSLPFNPVCTCLSCFARVCAGCGGTRSPAPPLPDDDPDEVIWCCHDSRLLALQLLLNNFDASEQKESNLSEKKSPRRSSEPNWKKALAMPGTSKRRFKQFCQVGHLLKSSSPQASSSATQQTPHAPQSPIEERHLGLSQSEHPSKALNTTPGFSNSGMLGWDWPQYGAVYPPPAPNWYNDSQYYYSNVSSWLEAAPPNHFAAGNGATQLSTSNTSPFPPQQLAQTTCSAFESSNSAAVVPSSTAPSSTILPATEDSHYPYHGTQHSSLAYPQPFNSHLQSVAEATVPNFHCKYAPSQFNLPMYRASYGPDLNKVKLSKATNPNILLGPQLDVDAKQTPPTPHANGLVHPLPSHILGAHPSTNVLAPTSFVDGIPHWEAEGLDGMSSSPSTPSRSKLPKGIGYGEATKRQSAIRNRGSHSWRDKIESVQKERTNRDSVVLTILGMLRKVLPNLERESDFDLDPPSGLIAILLTCSLMEEMAELLRNDSIADATRRKDLYLNLFLFVGNMAKHPSTVDAILSSRPSGDLVKLYSDNSSARPSIATCMTNLVKQSRMILKRSQLDSKALHIDEEGDMLGVCIAVNDLAALLQPYFHDTNKTSAVGGLSKTTDDDRWTEWHRQNCVLEIPDADMLEANSFSGSAKSLKQGAKGRMKRLVEESANLTTSLPEGIFMKYAESRPDVMKVLIIGPQGTPYENGAFEFDVWCPANYPQEPPQFHFRTTGKGKGRFNPNLYEDGKVCLSLLNTWSGERWKPGESTLLQVLVSLQAMVFCEQPYYNEPGYENHVSNAEAERYNNRVRGLTVRLAMLDWLRGDKTTVWNSILWNHFARQRGNIKERLKLWRAEGKQTFTDSEVAELTQALESFGSRDLSC